MRIGLVVSLLMYSADDAKIDSFRFIGSVLWDSLDLQPDITQNNTESMLAANQNANAKGREV